LCCRCGRGGGGEATGSKWGGRGGRGRGEWGKGVTGGRGKGVEGVEGGLKREGGFSRLIRWCCWVRVCVWLGGGELGGAVAVMPVSA
jgi:hypothetical protein